MGTIWIWLNGKKTAIAALLFLGNLLFRVVSGEPVDPAEIGAAIIAVIGVSHKVVKAVEAKEAEGKEP